MGTSTISPARHYLPGGREQGGGIGRMVGYIVDAAAVAGTRHIVTDTRGPRWSPLASPLRLLAAVAALCADCLAARGRVQHIHVAGRGSTARKVILAAVARAIGARHVLHLHDYDYLADVRRRPAWQQAVVRHTFRNADRVVVLGARDRDTVRAELGVAAERITVLPNAVPDPGEVRTPGGVPTIVFLGQLGARKGVPELLAALGSTAMAELGWRAILAGDGPVEHYRAEAAALGLSARVTMPGWLDEAATRALCAAGDILVLPSRSEGLSMAVLEGLAHGLAVVTTPVGAHPEVITDGVTGLLVPVDDADALAQALARLVAEPAPRARLGAAGRALYAARYSMPAYLAGLEAVYAGARPAPRGSVVAETTAP